MPIVQAIRRAGPRTLVFGADAPYLHPGVELHKIRLLGLPRDRESLVLGGNLLRPIIDGPGAPISPDEQPRGGQRAVSLPN